jgi:hypothetical protein
MNKFYVIEIQTNADGTSGNLVFSYAEKADAEEKLHQVSAVAAKSAVLVHSVAMLTCEGALVKNESYTHPVEE